MFVDCRPVDRRLSVDTVDLEMHLVALQPVDLLLSTCRPLSTAVDLSTVDMSTPSSCCRDAVDFRPSICRAGAQITSNSSGFGKL